MSSNTTLRAPWAVLADWRRAAILLLSAAGFAALFGEPILSLLREWWSEPEAGHGLLLAPVALWLAWRKRPVRARPTPGSRVLGLLVLLGAIVLRYLAGLAAGQFTMRLSVVMALVGLTTFYLGVRQVRTWGLPFALLALAVPLPEIVRASFTLPLQLKASQMGAALLQWREIPVRLAGNIIEVPGHKLFVTEACSGLRSLTALVATSVLLGAMLLRVWVSRVALVAGAVGIAIGMNAIRVFLTGFVVVFINPAAAEGFLHWSGGWLLFLLSLALTAGLGYALRRLEQWIPAARSAFRHPARVEEAP